MSLMIADQILEMVAVIKEKMFLIFDYHDLEFYMIVFEEHYYLYLLFSSFDFSHSVVFKLTYAYFY